eukprot:5222012-Karenia_brevis.AAC.1
MFAPWGRGVQYQYPRPNYWNPVTALLSHSLMPPQGGLADIYRSGAHKTDDALNTPTVLGHSGGYMQAGKGWRNVEKGGSESGERLKVWRSVEKGREGWKRVEKGGERWRGVKVREGWRMVELGEEGWTGMPQGGALWRRVAQSGIGWIGVDKGGG